LHPQRSSARSKRTTWRRTLGASLSRRPAGPPDAYLPGAESFGNRDEVGYLPLDDLGTTIFFQLVSARYERGSIILTSNKSYGEWGSIFGDSIIATAILDRLLHHSTTINIRGESYRLKASLASDAVEPSAAFWRVLGATEAEAKEWEAAARSCSRGGTSPALGAVPYMNFRGGEFSTGEMGNFHPALTKVITARIAVQFCIHWSIFESTGRALV
jgi:IstB-like ATP binding protein